MTLGYLTMSIKRNKYVFKNYYIYLITHLKKS